MHADGGGLYLQVTRAGVPSWVFRYMRDGRERYMGLGPLHTISLAEARDKALECRKKRLDGADPIDERKKNRDAARQAAKIEAAKTITFQNAAEQYIAGRRWRNPKHAAQWPATLGTYAYPIFGDLPVQSVDVGLVLQAVEPIWSTKPETASRVRGRIEAVLSWATVRGYRVGDNPARWRGYLEEALQERNKVRAVKHHAALPYPEISTFLAELRQQAGIAARALEFAILTAARTGEVIGARWSEFNLKERLWIVPAERMKAGKEHRVPLSDAAAAIVDEMAEIRAGEFVFPSARSTGQPISQMAMLMTLRRMGRGDLTVHGFRSTFKDWALERSSFPTEVSEMALAHTVSDKVEAAYRRGTMFEKRRQLAAAWAKFCAAPPVLSAKVVPIGAR